MAEKVDTVRVTPTRHISGLIDGTPWSAPGEPMDVSAASAVHLLEAGDVVEFVEDEKVETAAAPAAEVETATRKRG